MPLRPPTSGSVTDQAPLLLGSAIHCCRVCTEFALPRGYFQPLASTAETLRKAYPWETWDSFASCLYSRTAPEYFWTFLRQHSNPGCFLLIFLPILLPSGSDLHCIWMVFPAFSSMLPIFFSQAFSPIKVFTCLILPWHIILGEFSLTHWWWNPLYSGSIKNNIIRKHTIRGNKQYSWKCHKKW